MHLCRERIRYARILGVAASMCVFSFSSAISLNSVSPFAVSEEDRNVASGKLVAKGPFDLARIQNRHIDGVKGMVVTSVQEPPAFPGALSDLRLDAIRVFACTSAIFGPAELLEKQAFTGKEDVGIFTKLRFRIIDDWRAVPDSDARIVDIVVSGGEARWNGELIRIETKNQKFNVKGQYLLIAGKRIAKLSGSLYADPIYLEIDNNAIYPGPGWTPFPPGTSLKNAKADVAKALSMKECK